MTTEMLNELSLFSGYGGFSLGLRLAGINIRTVAYVEWDKYPQQVIQARQKDGLLSDAPIFSDISSFRGEQFRGLVDLITAGFPCQPHSVAGLQRGADDERNLWPETLRVIREVAPRYVLLENVPGLLSASSDGGRPAYGGTVVGELASLGYSVHWQTIGADDVGAPHRRKRWWCIAVAESTSDGLHTSQSGVIREDNESSSPREDATEAGRRSSSSSHGRDTEPDGRSNELDDSQHDGQPEPQEPRGVGSRVHPQTGPVQPEQPTGSSVSATGGEELADSDNSRGREDIQPPELWTTRTQQPPGDSGLHRQGEDGEVQTGRWAIYPTWPPSPNDTDAWERVLRERPDLASALSKEAESQFRRMDNGRSHRVDELKALGNGIVPAVVAEFLRRVEG